MASCLSWFVALTCLEAGFGLTITFDANVSVDGGLVEIQTVIPSFMDEISTAGCFTTTEVLKKRAVSLAKHATCELDRMSKEAELTQ